MRSGYWNGASLSKQKEMGSPRKWQWQGKVALVTGASQGIGAACSQALARAGARLSLTALPGSGFERSETPTTLITPGDITCPETRREVIRRTIRHFGRVDVLINNAGVGQYGYPSEVDVEISKRLFDVNVFSALALTQLAIPHMRRQNGGTIVNIGSVGGKVSLPWAAMYCATKWALHCVDDALRRELQDSGIRVVKVCPGIVATGFRANVLAGRAPGPVEDIRRVVTADQVADAVLRGVERGARTVYVPAIGRLFTAMEFFAPAVMDWYVRSKFALARVERPAPGGLPARDFE
jgi:short-subunit dehydrogenase